jgi:hypothetical protein
MFGVKAWGCPFNGPIQSFKSSTAISSMLGLLSERGLFFLGLIMQLNVIRERPKNQQIIFFITKTYLFL